MSKSGIEVYERTAKNGERVLTSYKDGAIFKQITKEATQLKQDGSSSFNTLVKNYGKDEFTSITKHTNQASQTSSIHSRTKAWDGKTDVNTMQHELLKSYHSQTFKDGKLFGQSFEKNGRHTDMIYDKHYTTTHKHGTMTFPNGQVHDYRYEKFEVKPSAENKTEVKTYFKRFGIQGIEVTDKGATPIGLWNYSSGPEYFKTH